MIEENMRVHALEQEHGDDDEWERLRKELATSGKIFDTRGNVTVAGEELLKAAGWKTNQILYLEQLQQNFVAPVQTVYPSHEPVHHDGGHTTVRATQDRAQAALRDRATKEGELRNAQLMRRQVGIRAYDDALHRGLSERDAEEAKRRAEEEFDVEFSRRNHNIAP